MRNWLHALQTTLNSVNAPIFQSAGSGYLVLTAGRVLLIFLAFLMILRVVQAGRALIPRPHVAANVWYWLRWWFLLLVSRDIDLKAGGLIVGGLFLIQVVIGASGASVVLTWYILFQQFGAGLLFFGIARWATRLRRGAQDVNHEP